jgi:hypothetical protein
VRGADEPHHLHVANVMEIWEPKPPGTLRTTLGLLRDLFICIYYIIAKHIRMAPIKIYNNILYNVNICICAFVGVDNKLIYMSVI